MTRRRRRCYLALDVFVLAWCAFMGIAFAALGSLPWALLNWAIFAIAGTDACHQAKILREGTWSRWRVR